jgi:hypothetical protein
MREARRDHGDEPHDGIAGRQIHRRAALAVLLVCLGCGDGDGDGDRNHASPTVTPIPEATATPAVCPSRLALAIDGPAVDLDLGSTGIGYNVPLHEDGESCVVDGTDTLFGNTSYDCSPNLGGELGSLELE